MAVLPLSETLPEVPTARLAQGAWPLFVSFVTFSLVETTAKLSRSPEL